MRFLSNPGLTPWTTTYISLSDDQVKRLAEDVIYRAGEEAGYQLESEDPAGVEHFLEEYGTMYGHPQWRNTYLSKVDFISSTIGNVGSDEFFHEYDPFEISTKDIRRVEAIVNSLVTERLKIWDKAWPQNVPSKRRK